MPRGDRTGPAGFGPMTGRAAGYCAGYNAPGYTNPSFGPGYGFGRGFGWGFRRGFGWGFRGGYGHYYPTQPYPSTGAPNWSAPTKEQELEILKQQAANFEQSLQEIKKRIGELEG